MIDWKDRRHNTDTNSRHEVGLTSEMRPSDLGISDYFLLAASGMGSDLDIVSFPIGQIVGVLWVVILLQYSIVRTGLQHETWREWCIISISSAISLSGICFSEAEVMYHFGTSTRSAQEVTPPTTTVFRSAMNRP